MQVDGSKSGSRTSNLRHKLPLLLCFLCEPRRSERLRSLAKKYLLTTKRHNDAARERSESDII